MNLSGASFLKRGKDAVNELKNPVLTGSSGSVMRFFLKYTGNIQKDSALITFLDGPLVPKEQTDGEIVFDVPGAYEHSQLVGKAVHYYVCTLENEGACPCCDDRMNRFYNLYFTVIDHRRNVSSQGKVYENNKRIFSVNQATLARLVTMLERDLDPILGMFRMQVTASKLAAKSSPVGDFFRYVKYVDLSTLEEQGIDVKPLDFNVVLNYRSVDALYKLGFGKEKFQNSVNGVGELLPLDDTEDDLGF